VLNTIGESFQILTVLGNRIPLAIPPEESLDAASKPTLLGGQGNLGGILGGCAAAGLPGG
jgi:hypothetical protein